MSESPLQYEALLADVKASSKPPSEYLRQEPPYLCQDAYFRMKPRPTNILVFTHGTFDYVYDDYVTLASADHAQSDDEARLN